MNKEEILKKSRDQKEDEGTVYAENKGRRFGLSRGVRFSRIVRRGQVPSEGS